MYQVNNIIKGSSNVIEGVVFENFISTLDYLDEIEKQELIKSTKEILEKSIPSRVDNLIQKYNDTTGIVLGYVQSGKTLSFTSLIALACDNNYKLVIVLAGKTNLLLSQNTDRLIKTFLDDRNINVLTNVSDNDFIDKLIRRFSNKQQRTYVVTLLKHQKHILQLSKLLGNKNLSNIFTKNSVLIIDDESDQASLNTNARKKNVESAIYSSIKSLRKVLPNNTYIQYTATPQANLLIDYLDFLSPDWHVLIKPGKKYTGGLSFFENSIDNILSIPKAEKYHSKDNVLEKPPVTLKASIYNYIFSSIYLINNKYNKNIFKLESTSMMIHPCSERKTIKKFYDWTNNIIKALQVNLDNLEYKFLDECYRNFLKYSTNNIVDEIPLNEIIELINDEFMDNLSIHEVVGGYVDKAFPWHESKFHILVGGQLLDRGFTVENLIYTYMPRDTKGKNNADTIEQRCRFFGYKRDYFKFCRVYIPNELKVDYQDYVKSEEDLRSKLSKMTLSEFKKMGSIMISGQNLNLTNTNRISGELVTNKFKHFNYFEPFLNFEKNNELIINFIDYIKEDYLLGELKPKETRDSTENTTHLVYKIPYLKVLEFLETIDIGNTIEKQLMVSLLNVLKIYCEIEKKSDVYIIQISHKKLYGRERTINEISTKEGGNPLKISSLASNFPSYFGDSKLLLNDQTGKFEFQYNDEAILQLHKLHAVLDTNRKIDIYNKSFYTIAFKFSDNINLNTIYRKV